MTAAHYTWPAHTAASSITDNLADTHNRLLRATATIQNLALTDPDYRGTRGIRIGIALQCAISDVRRAQRAHQLAAHNPYYSSRAIHAATHNTGTDTVRSLHDEIAAARAELTAAADAAALLAADNTDPIGCLGWDLETAIDSARGHLSATLRPHHRHDT
jgi:hypothetical protein